MAYKMNEMGYDMTQRFTLTGMDCAACAETIARGVARLPGVAAAEVDFTTGLLRVDGDIGPEAVAARVRELGYGLVEPGQPVARTWASRLPEGGPLGFVRFLLARRETTLAVVGALLILPSLLFHELFPMAGIGGPWLDATALLALALAGWPIAHSAWRTLRVNHELGINALMTLAAVGAVVIGAYAEAGLVMVLFAIGEALEGYTTERARASIKTLLAVAPDEATVVRACQDCATHRGQAGYVDGPCPFCGDEELRVPVAEVRVGERLRVKPGERIALDGRVLSGASSVNQAPITGESLPVLREPSDPVFAGSVNGEGVLEVEVTHLAGDSTLSRIIHLVENAQARKAPVERFVTRFARVYTPAVVALAALVAGVPPVLWGQPFWGEQGWLYRALELLVVACPCALVISTPVTVLSAIASAARQGVLIKGGASLEALAATRVVAFDKTGTLTTGRPTVTRVRAIDCQVPDGRGPAPACPPCATLLGLAGALERQSEHPLAHAIVTAADQSPAPGAFGPVTGVTALPGLALTGSVGGQAVVLGSHRHFDASLPHQPEQCAEIVEAAQTGHTPILVGVAGRYRGYITVSDPVRPGSANALRALRDLGIKTAMLSGDAQAVAKRVGAEVGVDQVQAELLPADKVAAVDALRQSVGPVAMVGDGLNDAPALASAAVGIAVGAGSGQALETADVVLMRDDLRQVPLAVQLARQALSTLRANIGLAIGIKLAFVGLVLIGLGSMWLAVVADVGASLLVTLNGMRLLRR
jgi:Cd2+/Zn2+-exporting ATPase